MRCGALEIVLVVVAEFVVLVPMLVNVLESFGYCLVGLTLLSFHEDGLLGRVIRQGIRQHEVCRLLVAEHR